MKEKIIEIMFTYSGYEEKHYTKKVLREEEYNIVAEEIVKLFATPAVVFSEAEVCQMKQKEYERGIEDGKTIAEHGTVHWQT